MIFVGYKIFKDYGISLDENITRYNGLVSTKYIITFFSLEKYFNLDLFSDVIELKNYSENQYGAIFEILQVFFIEVLFNITEYSEIYYYRHLTNHYLFLLSIFCFYFLTLNIFKNKFYSLFGSLVLYTTPRIFAESFYNGKDLAFLSIFIFLIYFAIKNIKKPNIYNSLLFSLFAALAINLRIIAIYIPFLVILFHTLQSSILQKINIKKIIIITSPFFFITFFLYLSWPYLWDDPINNFLSSFKNFSRFTAMIGYVFYLGEYQLIRYLPWHYPYLYFFATTPILVSFLSFFGLVHISLRFIKRVLNINEVKKNNDIWKSENEKIFLFLFFVLFVPLFFIFVFDSIVYNGWRHLYFLYPTVVLIFIYAIKKISFSMRKVRFIKIINLIFIVVIINNFYNLVKFHPFQNVYFNLIFEKHANNLFEIDYWGVANKYSLENIIKKNPQETNITIGVASLADLWQSQKMLPRNLAKKITITGQTFDKSKFIFTNNFIRTNPKYERKYDIPNGYSKYSNLKVGNILINEFYIKDETLVK